MQTGWEPIHTLFDSGFNREGVWAQAISTNSSSHIVVEQSDDIDRNEVTHTHTHTHTPILSLYWILSGTAQVSQHQKGKTSNVKSIWMYWSKRVSGSGISWAICKSARWPRQITTPAPITHFLQAGYPSCCRTNSVKALKSLFTNFTVYLFFVKIWEQIHVFILHSAYCVSCWWKFRKVCGRFLNSCGLNQRMSVCRSFFGLVIVWFCGIYWQQPAHHS